MRLLSILHASFARLHGSTAALPDSTDAVPPERNDKFKFAYAEFASATTYANLTLQEHGSSSPQFASADVASMRLFHKAKKMQGLRKPRNN